jgi:rod shape-determining protein MreC
MRWIIDLVIRYRLLVSMIVACTASIWMISGSPRQQAQTARLLATSIFYPVQITVDQVVRAKNIYAENGRLKTAVALLNTEVAQLREEAAENTRLRDMLGFEQSTPFVLIPARVVARDPSPIFKSVVIDAGKDKGVVPFMPVVSRQGVVGKVVQVMPDLSLVQLIRDPLNHVSVMVRRSRTVSILETENGVDFFTHLRVHEDVLPGDTVITTGLGGIYPRGFLVGIINKVSFERDPLFKRAGIKLCLDIDHIEELFVIKLQPQWSAFKQQLDTLTLGKPKS